VGLVVSFYCQDGSLGELGVSSFPSPAKKLSFSIAALSPGKYFFLMEWVTARRSKNTPPMMVRMPRILKYGSSVRVNSIPPMMVRSPSMAMLMCAVLL